MKGVRGMKMLILAAIAATAFGQEFGTQRGTEVAEVLGGITYGHGNGRTYPTYTARIRGGFNRYLSGHFDYNYTRLVDEVGPPQARGSISFFMPGVQVHAGLGRVEPYLLAGFGSQRTTIAAEYLGASARVDQNRFAQAIGGGVRLYPARHLGFSLEYRALHTNGLGWISQASVGVFAQFGGR